VHLLFVCFQTKWSVCASVWPFAGWGTISSVVSTVVSAAVSVTISTVVSAAVSGSDSATVTTIGESYRVSTGQRTLPSLTNSGPGAGADALAVDLPSRPSRQSAVWVPRS